MPEFVVVLHYSITGVANVLIGVIHLYPFGLVLSECNCVRRYYVPCSFFLHLSFCHLSDLFLFMFMFLLRHECSRLFCILAFLIGF